MGGVGAGGRARWWGGRRITSSCLRRAGVGWQALLEPTQAGPDPRLDRAFGYVEDLGHLTVGVPAVKGQLNGGAFVLVKRLQGRADLLDVNHRDEFCVNVGRWRLGFVMHAVFAPRPCSFASDHVDGEAVRLREQHRAQLSASSVEPFGLAPQAYKYLLGHIFGESSVAEQAPSETVHRRRVATVCFAERGLVTLRDAGHESGIVSLDEKIDFHRR